MHWVSQVMGQQFEPHGYCLLWLPWLIWTHVISDAVIALAYFSIPVALVYFMRKRPDIEFGWIIWLFALFIVACGTTHAMSVWTLWHGDYVIEGMIKAVTAAASIGTAIALWPAIPRMLAIPSPTQVATERDKLASTLDELTREIARRKKAEDALRQSQKMEAIGQLTGGIAHDFNNLLQTVTGALDMISRQPEGPKVQKWATLGLQAADKGSKLTAQMLAFSRTQKLSLRPLTVAPLLMGMRDLIETAAGPEIQVRYELAGPDLVHVLGDPTQIELAVLNLTINARDAMPHGGSIELRTQHVEVSGDPELEDGRYLELSVSDTGVGMPEEVRSRAFEPFFSTKRGKGSGLGLAMVYGLARQSQGRAQIDSSPGAGTRVSILFRVVEDEAAQAEQPRPGGGAATSATILLVDDEEAVRTVTAGMLEELGHKVIEADSGEVALDLLRSIEPDLLVLDYAMPNMNGAELARKLGDLGVEAPILFISGYSDSDALLAQCGADTTILKKPFSSAELREATSTILAACSSKRGTAQAAE